MNSNAVTACNTPNSMMTDRQIIQYKWTMVNVARRICPEFQVLPEHKEALLHVFNYCMMLSDPAIDHNKGLWLWGGVGAGKSTLLRVMKEFGALVRPYERGWPYSFRITSAVKVAADFTDRGYTGLATYIDTRHQAFDDIGVEPESVQYYGSPANPIEYILMARYDRKDDFTHVTSNLSVREVKNRYGIRVADRIHEMFNVIEIPGSSLR